MAGVTAAPVSLEGVNSSRSAEPNSWSDVTPIDRRSVLHAAMRAIASAARLLLYVTEYDRIFMNAVLFVALQIALLPAILGLVRLARERAPILARVGGAAALLGVIGHLVFSGVKVAGLAIAQLGATPELVRAYAQIATFPLVLPVMVAGFVGTFLGFPLLGLALWRTKAVPAWMPAAIALGILLEFGAGFGSIEYVGLAGSLLYALGLGGVGLHLLVRAEPAPQPVTAT
jgi:hypothetical protein